jgi:hypothetical protein
MAATEIAMTDRTTSSAADDLHLTDRVARWLQLRTQLPTSDSPWETPGGTSGPLDTGDLLELVALGNSIRETCQAQPAQMVRALLAGASVDQIAAALFDAYLSPNLVRQEVHRYILSARNRAVDTGADHPTAAEANGVLALIGYQLPAELQDFTGCTT